ncbi:hypothetical protein GCM10023176_37290 [Micromonospora coerulea]|uniref:Uncharacterized protein n=1 Tax=Micromonospora coerulea TaxID=47856 RepID=A0ABP8SQQ6_9ACTN
MHVELGVAQHGERQRDAGPPVGVLARVQPLASDDSRPAVPAHVLHQMYRADPVEGGQEHPAQRPGHRGDAGPAISHSWKLVGIRWQVSYALAPS